MLRHAPLLLFLLQLPCPARGGKVYWCKWPRSVLSSGDPNLMTDIDLGNGPVRCDRTLQSDYICPAACAYGEGEPWECFGPLESEGAVCNEVWASASRSYWQVHELNETHACLERWNSEGCTNAAGGPFCRRLNECYGSYQQIIYNEAEFVNKFGEDPPFLNKPFEILDPPVCTGYSDAECCLSQINFFRCLHGSPPVLYHAGIAQSAQAWADLEDKPTIHSQWGGDFYPQYIEVLTWGTALATNPCERGVNAWYQEVAWTNFSIHAWQHSGPDGTGMSNGHFVLMTWANHTMVGCGTSDFDAGIVVCSFAWRWDLGAEVNYGPNLKPRSDEYTQERCRTLAVDTLQLPVVPAGQDIDAQQQQALWDMLEGSAPTTTTEEPSEAPCTVPDGTGVSDVYPCTCGNETCTTGQMCDESLNLCEESASSMASTTTLGRDPVASADAKQLSLVALAACVVAAGLANAL